VQIPHIFLRLSSIISFAALLHHDGVDSSTASLHYRITTNPAVRAIIAPIAFHVPVFTAIAVAADEPA
jgi:hypothetical protein